jgi:ABC-type uncharacterized transport system ATPase subunit
MHLVKLQNVRKAFDILPRVGYLPEERCLYKKIKVIHRSYLAVLRGPEPPASR